MALGSAILLVAVAPQLLGGALPWAVMLTAALGVLGLAATQWSGLKWSPSPITWAVLAAFGFTIVQRIPLPRAVWAWLSPARLTLLEPSLDLVDASGTWLPLSLDPGATSLAILTGCAIVSAWLMGDALGRRGASDVVVQIAAGSAVLMAVVVALHWVTGSVAVFGVYTPQDARPQPLAPLMNPNHLGGFMAFGATLCLALALGAKNRPKVTGWLAAAIVCAGLVPATGSRGAAASLLVGFFGLGAALLIGRRRKKRSSSPWRWATFGVGALLSLGAGAYLGYSALAQQVVNGDMSKLARGLEGLALVPEFPLGGVGRGAFGSVFASRAGSSVRFEGPENLVVQWVAEWGIPVGAFLLVALGVAVVRALRRRRRISTVGAVVALAALALHDLVDFALELSGVVTVAAFVAGAVLTPARPARSASPSPPLPHGSSGSSTLRWATLATLGVALVAGLASRPTSGSLEARNLHSEASSWSASEWPAVIDAGVRNHPLEPGVVLIGAWQALRTSHPRAGRWLNRSMELAPEWAGPHLLAARWLWSIGARDQAALELREAETLLEGHGVSTACEWARADETTAATLALRAAPVDATTGARFLERIAQCAGSRSATAEAIDRELLDRGADLAGPHVRQAARTDDGAERAIYLQRAVERVEGADARREIQVALARALSRADRAGEAASLLDRLDGPHDRPWLEARVEAAILGAEDADEDDLVQSLKGLAHGSPTELARIHVFLSRIRARGGELHQSLADLERASRLAPDPRTTREIAVTAESAGNLGRAARAYGELCGDSPGSNDCRQLERLQGSTEQRMPLAQPSP